MIKLLLISLSALILSCSNLKPCKDVDEYQATNVYQDKELIECPGIFNYETERCEVQ